jgi:DNA invertase Pin-like site-specific DNA recombinase
MSHAADQKIIRRYFLYARKSTDEPDRQVLSLDAQLHEMRELARLEHLIVEREFVESMSAKEPGRPIFDMMLTEIEEGKANGILAWHPDRLARNSMDGGKIIYFLDAGLLTDLRFKAFWFENTPQGKFMLNMAFGESKYYVDALSANVWRGIRHKLALGQYPGRPPPGYRNEPKERTIVVDAQTAPLVRKVFRAFASGRYNLAQIRRRATAWGLLNTKGKAHSSPWFAALLSNSFYVGLIRYDGRHYPGTHEPLISKRQFHRVQQALIAHVRSRRGKRQKHFAFRGMIVCGDCGCAVTAQVQKGHHYYRCTHKKEPCPARGFVREEGLAAQMWTAWRRATLTERTANNMTCKARRMKERAAASCEAMLAEYRERLATAERRLENLSRLRATHDVTEEEYATARERYLRDKITYAGKVQQIEKKGDDYWREPLLAFIKESYATNLVAENGSAEDLRNFHCRIGTKLLLLTPDAEHPPPKNYIASKASASGAKHPGRRYPQPTLYALFPYPWRIVAERQKKTTWQNLLMELVAYFNDPTHPDYAEEEDARASLRRGRKRQPPRTSAPPEGGATGLGTSSPTSTGAG